MSARPPLPAGAVALLACPACAAALTPDDGEGVLRCPAGHAFDRARQGHVTLLPPGHRAPSADTAAMVADRVTFLDGGHFAGLTRALGDVVLDGVVPERPITSILDVGGGTGHHLAGVLDRLPGAAGAVLDSSGYAARRAARAHPRALAVVADSWARWPVRDGVVDRVLVVFAPRNGAESARVLRPGGRLVVVTPTVDHLGELVGPLGLLTVDPGKADRLTAGLEPYLTLLDRVAHRAELSLDRAAVRALVGMGPHAHHVDPVTLDRALGALDEPVATTLAVEISTYTDH